MHALKEQNIKEYLFAKAISIFVTRILFNKKNIAIVGVQTFDYAI